MAGRPSAGTWGRCCLEDVGLLPVDAVVHFARHLSRQEIFRPGRVDGGNVVARPDGAVPRVMRIGRLPEKAVYDPDDPMDSGFPDEATTAA